MKIGCAFEGNWSIHGVSVDCRNSLCGDNG